MVHLTKSLIIASILIAPSFAAPLHFSQDEIDLIARDPSFFGKLVRKVTPIVNKVRSVVRKVAPVAAMIPGPIGAVGAVASAVARRELEDSLYTRAIQDELNARGYDLQIGVREVEGLESRDYSEALDARDNIYSLVARQFIDTMEMEARRELSDELEARQLAEPSLDQLD
jgi:hypothetical protein